MDENNKIVKEDNIIYCLNEDDKTANVIDNDKACHEIIIPRSIEYEEEEFIITAIKENSFKNSKITSINFPIDSELKIIAKDAFTDSELKQIWISSSVVELEKRCFYHAHRLRKVTTMRNNQF
ncbi:hypothetical protein M9Y10_012864 [Tritrichomonas musculus]|uniref:Uncharacterized protein n=1 Tax=Tritrichomonas musculus TaxID=1915356 RepID=A0ABR2IEH4_9EUKA